MRNKPYRKGDRFIEFIMSGVFVFMKQPFRSPRFTGLGGRKITGLIGFLGFFFIFLSLHVVYSVLGLLCFVRAGGLSRLARGQLCSAHYESL